MVAHNAKSREAGQTLETRTHRTSPIDEYLPRTEELVARSGGRVRADVVRLASRAGVESESTVDTSKLLHMMCPRRARRGQAGATTATTSVGVTIGLGTQTGR